MRVLKSLPGEKQEQQQQPPEQQQKKKKKLRKSPRGVPSWLKSASQAKRRVRKGSLAVAMQQLKISEQTDHNSSNIKNNDSINYDNSNSNSNSNNNNSNSSNSVDNSNSNTNSSGNESADMKLREASSKDLQKTSSEQETNSEGNETETETEGERGGGDREEEETDGDVDVDAEAELSSPKRCETMEVVTMSESGDGGSCESINVTVTLDGKDKNNDKENDEEDDEDEETTIAVDDETIGCVSLADNQSSIDSNALCVESNVPNNVENSDDLPVEG